MIMKKTIVILSAVLALVACNKETPSVQNDGTIDASKVVFDITINNSDDTKAVKSGWASGDKVYLFFEGVTSGYVVTEYDGSVWTPTLEGTATLSASGKKVTAVFLPFNTDEPTYDGGAWKFEEFTTYYMTAEAQEYTVTTDPSTDLSTLSATLDMENSQGFVQIFIPDASPVDGKFVMYAEGLIPTWCESIVPGGFVTAGEAAAGLPIEAEIVDGEGYYFYGTVFGSITNPTFYIVEQDPTGEFAIGTRVKSITGKSLAPNAAVKFSTLPIIEPWVDIDGTKWATGNVSGHFYGTIVAPTEYGDYYSWNRSDEESSSYNYSDMGYDTATYLLGYDWRMPTDAEFIALCGASGEKAEWIASPAGIKVTGDNGLAVFFPAAGRQSKGSQYDQGNGYYWSSDLSGYSDLYAYFLVFGSGYVTPDDFFDLYRNNGFSVRPVHN